MQMSSIFLSGLIENPDARIVASFVSSAPGATSTFNFTLDKFSRTVSSSAEKKARLKRRDEEESVVGRGGGGAAKLTRREWSSFTTTGKSGIPRSAVK